MSVSHAAILPFLFIFLNDTPTTELYTLSLHDALPISCSSSTAKGRPSGAARSRCAGPRTRTRCSSIDRKSTRLNSSHANISYAVFCLKKKNNVQILQDLQLMGMDHDQATRRSVHRCLN